MTREHKLALIVSFSLILVLGVLVSDHFSKASKNSPLAVEMREPAGSPFSREPGGPGSRGTMSTAVPTSPLNSIAPMQKPMDVPRPQERPPADPTQMPADLRMAGRPAPHDAPIESAASRVGSDVVLSHVTEGPILAEPRPEQIALPISGGGLKRHDVKEGDVVYDIARRYYGDGSLWTKLRDYNKGKVSENGGLRGGVTLEVPPKDVLLGQARLGDPRPADGAKAAANVAQSNARTDGKNDSKIAGIGAYVVQEGDTLHSIARKKLGSTRRIQEIVDANRGVLEDPDDLKVGMSIHVPSR